MFPEKKNLKQYRGIYKMSFGCCPTISAGEKLLQVSSCGATSGSLFSNKSFSINLIRRSSGLSRLCDARARDDNDCRVYHFLTTIQIVIARNRGHRPSSRITKRLSARGKHLLLKCTLRSAGASIFQRAPELFVFAVSPSNYWR